MSLAFALQYNEHELVQSSMTVLHGSVDRSCLLHHYRIPQSCAPVKNYSSPERASLSHYRLRCTDSQLYQIARLLVLACGARVGRSDI